MEHTGLIMTPALDFVVTHELGHEWWYALISNDQAEAPWLDEAFASYAEEAAGAQGHPWCRRPGRGTRLVTRGTAFFRARSFRGYGAVYSEGACLLDLLRAPHRRARASTRRCATTRSRTATAGRRRRRSGRRWTPPRRCRSTTSGAATGVQ